MTDLTKRKQSRKSRKSKYDVVIGSPSGAVFSIATTRAGSVAPGNGFSTNERSQLKIVAFALSGLFIGIAGGIWGYYLTYLKPTIFFQILTSAEIVLMAILGGRGTVAGPVIGAIVLVAADELVVAELGSDELNVAAKGAAMIVVLLAFPDGIVGTLKARRRLPRILDWG